MEKKRPEEEQLERKLTDIQSLVLTLTAQIKQVFLLAEFVDAHW